MGYLRTYLALCVVIGHATAPTPWPVHHPRQAVQIFFCMSGFYMAMILSASYDSTREFYLSRILRIFGPYYAVLILVFLGSLLPGLLSGQWLALTAYATQPLEQNGLLGIALSAASNLTLFFQDWLLFLRHDHGGALQFTADFAADPAPLHRFLVVPQSWSMGIEETFYLLAPILNRFRTRTLALIAVASLLARLYAYRALGLEHDPFTYRFFPFEILMFLLGVLAWRLYVHWDLGRRLPQCTRPGSYALACVALTAAFSLHAVLVAGVSHYLPYEYVVLGSYPVWALAVAVLFAWFRQSTIDRTIGELCYPIYLIHHFVIRATLAAALALGLPLRAARGACVGLSLLAAIALFALFVRPYDRWRRAYVAGWRARRLAREPAHDAA